MQYIYIGLSASYRDDGTMFIVSRTHPYITAVVDDGDWDAVLKIVKAILQQNIGPVKSIEYVENGTKLPPNSGYDRIPPAHVIAASVALERAGIS